MDNVISTIGALIIKDKKVLLVCHGKTAEHLSGKYGLPAGRIENDENIQETVIRELREETGLLGDINSLILISKQWQAQIQRKDGIKNFSLQVFLVNSYTGELRNDNETTPEWINIQDLDKYDLLPNVKEIIEEGLKSKNENPKI